MRRHPPLVKTHRGYRPVLELLESRWNPSGLAPTAADDAFSVARNGNLTASVVANDTDPENDYLNASVVTSASHGMTMLSMGTLYYYPTYGYTGTDTFTYKVNDGTSDSNTATVTITVTGSDPVAPGGSYTVHQGKTLSTLDLLGGSTSASLYVTQYPAHGSVWQNYMSSQCSYSANMGYVGTDTFKYKVYEGGAYSAEATVTIDVTNTVPTANDDGTFSVHQGKTLSNLNLLANDSDPDADYLTLYVTQYPQHGSVWQDWMTGEYSYSANMGYVGADSFKYKLWDGAAYSAEATVTFDVTNTVPTAGDDGMYSVHQGKSLTGLDLLANDADADGDHLWLYITQSPQHGSVQQDWMTGKYTYYASMGYVGADTFKYKVWDGAAYSAEATVSFDVTNTLPVAVSDGTFNVHTGQSVSGLNLLGNDSDADGDHLSMQITQYPQHGWVYQNWYDGTYTYYAYSGYYGPDAFKYKLHDGAEYSSEATVTMNVADAAPVANGSLSVTTGHDTVVTESVAESDADGDYFWRVFTDTADHGTFAEDEDGDFTYTPYLGYVGSDTVSYYLTDGTRASGLVTLVFNFANSTLTWDGGPIDPATNLPTTNNLASTAANWTGDVRPVEGDTIIFDGTSTRNAAIDIAFPARMAGMQINAGYTGRVIVERDFGITGTLGMTTGTITGSGSLTIQAGANFNWTGGDLAGDGTTTVAAGATLNATANNASIRIVGRRLNVNPNGTMNWNGSAAQGNSLLLVDGGVLSNDGTLNILTTNNRFSLIYGLNPTVLLENHGSINVTGTGTATLSPNRMTNRGIISVTCPQLRLRLINDFLNTGSGYFTAGQGATVSFESGEYTFSTLEDSSSNMMRGAGLFIAQARGVIDVPQFAIVHASNFRLDNLGTISGRGTFSAARFDWMDGSMEGDSEGNQGITEINPGDKMTIDGNVVLSRRQLLIRGLAEWQHYSESISVRDGGTIIVDGGTFEIISDGTISSLPDPERAAGPFVVQNNGLFHRGYAEPSSQPTIQIEFENNGGRVSLEGNITFQNKFRQTGSMASTSFGSGTYIFNPNTRSLGGSVTLAGGTLSNFGVGALSTIHENTRFTLAGTMTSAFRTWNCYVELTGDLGVATRWDNEGTEVHLRGRRASVTTFVNNNSEQRPGRLYYEGGSLSHNVFGNGQFIGQAGGAQSSLQIDAGGVLLVGSGGSFSTFTVSGDFTLAAGARVVFQIGANQHDLLVVQGHATLAGVIDAALVNGFVPNPNTPDEYQVITYASYDEAFANDSIDLGNALAFDVLGRDDGLSLITRWFV